MFIPQGTCFRNIDGAVCRVMIGLHVVLPLPLNQRLGTANYEVFWFIFFQHQGVDGKRVQLTGFLIVCFGKVQFLSQSRQKIVSVIFDVGIRRFFFPIHRRREGQKADEDKDLHPWIEMRMTASHILSDFMCRFIVIQVLSFAFCLCWGFFIVTRPDGLLLRYIDILTCWFKIKRR